MTPATVPHRTDPSLTTPATPRPGLRAVVRHARGDRGPAVAEIRARLARVGLLEGEHRPGAAASAPGLSNGAAPTNGAVRTTHAAANNTGPGDAGPGGVGQDAETVVIPIAVFDDQVDLAVRMFQQSRGITVDGIVGPETFRRLEEARWSLGDRVLFYSPGRNTSGDDVAALQARLSDLGFNAGRVDGLFGALTDTALREFQRGVGLDPDGTAGPATFRALARLGRTVTGGAPAQLRESMAWSGMRTGSADKIVVIDPGHGGADPGNRAPGAPAWTEARVATDIAERVEGRLAALGTTVLLTRGRAQDAEVLDEPARAAFANATSADLVVSLHVDGAPSPRAGGLASFYYGGGRYGVSSILGRQAAELLHEEILTRTDLTDCRSHPKTWDLLRLTRMPAVRLEIGYLSNDGDAARLRDAAFRDTVAEAVSMAVVRFFAPETANADAPV